MPPKNDALKVNPLIARLLESGEPGGVVELQGYVGPSEADVVSLYRSIGLDSHVDIPRDAVLDAAPVEGSADGRVRLYVRDSAELAEISVNRMRARSSAAGEPTGGRRLSDLVALAGRREPGGGRTNTLEATCSRVDQLIEGYADALAGEGVFGGAVDVVPGLRSTIEGRLKDAREFKRLVCDPVLA